MDGAGTGGEAGDSGGDARTERGSRAARGLRAVVPIVCVLAIVALTAAVGRLWYGAPYGTADPARAAERIQERSQRAYDLLRLPEPVAPAWNFLDHRVCRDRGLRDVTGDPEPGVMAPEHRWGVDGVSEGVARPALDRLRQRLTAQGWEHIHEREARGPGPAETGFRFEDPASGDTLDARWNSARGALFVDVRAPCARVPDALADASRDLFDRAPDGPFPDGATTGTTTGTQE
ncbi:hypothetical protein [Streptomyces niveus]|uniref:hypothetical protein n=1 Tax=Streptomyces niveus TaxID=193462 RepID=UPI00344C4ABD